MKRREFIGLIGGAATLPLAVRAQQSAFSVVGFLHFTSFEETRDFLAAFHRGLGETGYVENKNVTIEYRWGQGHTDRLPTLIEELARRQVSVIVVLGNTNGALAAKAATRTIPVVFMVGVDPVQAGLVDSLSKPGGNLTGISNLNVEVAAKRLELLLQMVPAAKSVAYLRNPTSIIQPEAEVVQSAARTLGVQLKFVDASDLREIEEGFTNVVQQQDALYVSADNFFNWHSD